MPLIHSTVKKPKEILYASDWNAPHIGTLDLNQVPDLPAEKITSGVLDEARIPNIYVRKAGDTMTGDLTISKTTPRLNLEYPNGALCRLEAFENSVSIGARVGGDYAPVYLDANGLLPAAGGLPSLGGPGASFADGYFIGTVRKGASCYIGKTSNPTLAAGLLWFRSDEGRLKFSPDGVTVKTLAHTDDATIAHDKSLHRSPTLPDDDVHRTSSPIDHPDGSITLAKLASGVLALSNLVIDVDKNWAGKKITNVGGVAGTKWLMKDHPTMANRAILRTTDDTGDADLQAGNMYTRGLWNYPGWNLVLYVDDATREVIITSFDGTTWYVVLRSTGGYMILDRIRIQSYYGENPPLGTGSFWFRLDEGRLKFSPDGSTVKTLAHTDDPVKPHVHDGTDAPKVKGIDPSIMQAGRGTLDSTGVANVTFPTPFPSGVTPKVFVSSRDAANSGVVLDVTSVSNTGFTVKGRKVTGVTSGTAGAHVHKLDYGWGTTSDAPLTNRFFFYASDGTSPGIPIDVRAPSGGGDIYSNKTGDHTHTVSAPAVGGISFDWLAVNL
jgi:hypothetical protein